MLQAYTTCTIYQGNANTPFNPVCASQTATCERKFFYVLEQCNDTQGGPPGFVAHAPEFASAYWYGPVPGSGDSPEEALIELKLHIKVS